MKRWLKLALGILLFPIVLFIILLILLYIPPVQVFVKDKAVAYAMEATGFDISVEKVRLSFPLSLVVEDVCVTDKTDTLLAVSELVADVQLMPLFNGKIEVDGIHLVGANVQSKDLIDGMEINGIVGNFYLQARGADMINEELVIDKLELENSSVDLCLSDTSASDTSSTAVKWKIKINNVSISDVGFAMRMPLDTLALTSYIGNAEISNGDVDLGAESYSLEHIKLGGASFGMVTTAETVDSLLFNSSDFMLSEIKLELDSILYDGKKVNAVLADIGAVEKTGLTLVSGKGRVMADEEYIYAKDFIIRTNESFLEMNGMAGWSLLDSIPGGNVSFKADMSLAPADAEFFIGKLHRDIPRNPVRMKMNVGGTLDKLYLSEMSVVWDKILDLRAKGGLENVLDSISRSATMSIDLKTGNLGFAEKAFSLTEAGLRLPVNMDISSDVEYQYNTLNASVDLHEGSSDLSLVAEYGLNDDSYKVKLDVGSFDVSHFYDIDSVSLITLNLEAEGRGLDFYDKKTNAKVNGFISQMSYQDYDLSNTRIICGLSDCLGELKVFSRNNWLKSYVGLDVKMAKDESSARLAVNIKDVALQNILSTESPFNLAVDVEIDASTDMKEMATVLGKIGNVVCKSDGKEIKPKDVMFDGYTNSGVSEFSVNAGDLFMTVSGDEGVTKIVEMLNQFSARLGEQLVAHELDYYELKNFLPDLYFELNADKDNPISNYLRIMNVDIGTTRLRLDCNPDRGLAGDFLLSEIKVDSVQLDSAYLWLLQDTTGIRYKMTVSNNSSLTEYVSNAVVEGNITGKYADILIDMFNPQGEKGLYIGCRSDFLEDGLRLSFFPESPAFMFRQFSLNENNYVMIRDSLDIDADLKFLDSKGTGFSFVSSVTRLGSKRLTASLTGIELADIRALVPTLIPDIKGVLSASMSYTKLKRTFSLTSNFNVDNFVYEKKPVADLSLALNYLPLEDETQMVMAKLKINDVDAAMVRGQFRPGENRKFRYNMELTDFPLSIANSFVPDDMINLEGTANAGFVMTGSFAKPILNGDVTFSNTSVYIPMAGARFRFDNTPLKVNDSRLRFDKFSLFTRTDNPFDIDGTVDFSDFSKMNIDMRFITSNYELLNARKSKESLVYGKVYIDANILARGPLSALKVRGDVRMLGNTNLSYILKESSLTVQDRLGETVTFVNFNDTTTTKSQEITPVSITGMDVLLNASIDPTASVNIYLSESGDNKVEVIGGGDLSMSYSPQGDLSLTGRYIFSGGKISYSLPMVNIADFTVKEGGFIQWTGNPMDPTMNLTAIKRVRTDVPNSGGDGTRKTNFDVSVNISNSLENLGLSFGIDAPEDAEIQNELTAMGEDERVKNALFMMAFNSYLGNGNNFNVNNALNSLMQREISNAAGKIQAVDLSLGMENPNGEEGLENMDISYKISKRFWNDRFSISLGGKISTGSNAAESNKESFIDNISVEYRLDNSGTRYVKLFHNKNYESVLEGEITETGLGVVLRKKMMKLNELFIFRRNKNKVTEDEKNIK